MAILFRKIILIALLLTSNCFGGYGHSGAGTVADPCQIWTATEYNNMCASGDASRAFVLGSNINFGDANINPMPSLTGVFDGNGFTISNAYVGQTEKWTALFNTLSGTIKNLTCTNINVDACSIGTVDNSSYVAVLVAELATSGDIDNCKIINCTVDGNQFNAGGTDVAAHSQYVGPLVGAAHGTVRNCTVTGGTARVTSNGGYDATGAETTCLGGLVGYRTAYTGVDGNMYNCTSTMTLTQWTDDANCIMYVGGLAGRTGNTDRIADINNCHYNGIIDFNSTRISKSLAVGGMVGTGDGRVRNSSAKGDVIARSGNTGAFGGVCVGGGAGGSISGADFNGCFADCNVKVNYTTRVPVGAGGFIGYQVGTTITDCYAKGSLVDINNPVAGTVSFNYGGGFAGRALTGTITRCWAVTTPFTNGFRDYGFAGDGGVTYSKCYWNKTLNANGVNSSGTNITDVNGETTTAMKTQSTYSGYNFVNVWNMKATPDYPTLLGNSGDGIEGSGKNNSIGFFGWE